MAVASFKAEKEHKPMVSRKRIIANRQNAKKSTGPRTKSGKARSAQNALKHGLSANRVVIRGEDPAAFEALRSDLIEHYQPANPIEEYLVRQIVIGIWLLKRVPEFEAGIFEHHYLDRQFERALIQSSSDVDGTEEREAIEQSEEVGPVLGDVFERAQVSLNNLLRLAGQHERSLYRAIHELERRKAESNLGEARAVGRDETRAAAGSRPRLVKSNG